MCIGCFMCVAFYGETTAILATILLIHINLFQYKSCVSLTYVGHVGKDLHKSEDSNSIQFQNTITSRALKLELSFMMS